MSRVGKKPISIPQGVTVAIDGQRVKVSGPKGEISQTYLDDVVVEQKEDHILVQPKHAGKRAIAVWGLTRALLQNAVKGVKDGFEKKLEIVGIGYKAAKDGDKRLKLDVGYSHSVYLDIPEGLNVVVEKNIITITGHDKQAVGQLAAVTRKVRPPEPYKGKGIRYFGEQIRRKEGKKAGAK